MRSDEKKRSLNLPLIPALLVLLLGAAPPTPAAPSAEDATAPAEESTGEVKAKVKVEVEAEAKAEAEVQKGENARPKTEDGRPETGDRRQETGDRAPLLPGLSPLTPSVWASPSTSTSTSTFPFSSSAPVLSMTIPDVTGSVSFSEERIDSITLLVKFTIGPNDLADNIWPKYVYPTIPSSSPYTTVEWFTNNKTGASLTVKGSGDFAPTIALGQLYWARAPEPLTRNGKNPGGKWVGMKTTPAKVDSSTTGPGRFTTNLDYQFMWEHDDKSVPEGCQVILTYTLTANPGFAFMDEAPSAAGR